MTTVSLNIINSANFTIFDNGDFTRIRGMASSNDGSKMYVVISGGSGIVKSTDYGATWNIVSNTGGTSIACSSDGRIIYVANLGNGLYKSTDYGNTWSYVTQGQSLNSIESDYSYTTNNIYQLACDASGTNLIMTTNLAKVIHLSTDGGATWTGLYNIPGADSQQSPVTLASNVDGSVFYAAFNNTDRKIYKSTDNGTTWNIISTLGNIGGPFSSLSTNLTGDFLFACDGSGNTDIFYETHSSSAVLYAIDGSLFTTSATYNNGNNILVMKNNATQTFSVNNLFPPGPIPGYVVPCFKEDSKILCFQNKKEKYVKVQDIRKGDLVKTLLHGYVPVDMIGTTKIYNSGNNLKSPNKLYKCSTSKYLELFEDLYITGFHSILTEEITDEQREKTVEFVGDIYITDNKYRLLACIDEKAEPYLEEGLFNIWHLALENEDYYMNYGIYANGLLVETSSKRYMKEHSGMKLLE